MRKSESEADQQRFRTVLYVTCEAVRIAALLVQPVMPESAGTLLDLLGQAQDQRTFAALGARLTPGTVLPPRRACSPLPERLGEANADGDAPVGVPVCDRMSGPFGAVERQRHRAPSPTKLRHHVLASGMFAAISISSPRRR